MKLKTILASAAALAATVTVATTVSAATYTFAGFDQGFALVKDENGNVRPGAELKDGKADLTKYGLGVIDTNQESPLTDKEKEEIFAPSEEEKFIKEHGLDKGTDGNPSVRLDDQKDGNKPSDTKKPEDKKNINEDVNKAKEAEKNLPQGKTTPKQLPKTSAVK
mgnify:FL=1|jgi:hypothetical protein